MTGIVAGVGFRTATTPEDIVALVRRALHEAGLAPDALVALATAADRAGAPNFLDVAAILDLPPLGIGPTALAAADAHVVTRSARIAASRGVGSVAEAAALAAAGSGARLILPRIASKGATCALARAPG